MNHEIGIGLIGAGDISLYHSQGIRECEGAKLVGFYDVLQERAQHRAKEFGGIVFQSPDELVANPEVDAVLVLTPLEAHFPNVKLALNAGKHVLVEKPVGITIAEIKEMKRLSISRNLVCMPGHSNIYHPGVEEMKRLVASDELGKLSAVYILYNIHHPEEVARKYPGVIRQIMTHHAYTLLYLAGQAESIQAMKQSQHYQEYTEEDIAIANVRMKNGALAHLEVSIAADDHSSDPWSLYMKVLGTEGSARFSHNDWVVNRKGIVHSHTYVAYPQTIKNEDAHFIACIRDGKQPLSTLDDAIIAQKMIEGIERSIAEGKTIII